jgi:hypothetical protein
VKRLVLIATLLASPAAAAEEEVLVPVVYCDTHWARRPHTRELSLPPVAAHLDRQTADRVAYYSDGDQLSVLGPRGWSCSATVAADSSQRLEVRPPGPSSGDAAIVAYSSAMCLSCVVNTACPVFADILATSDNLGRWRELNHALDCAPASTPAQEKLTRPDPFTAIVEDPPNVRGRSPLSGGANAATTLFLISPTPNSLLWAAAVDCALSSDQQSLCKAVVQDLSGWRPGALMGCIQGPKDQVPVSVPR